MAASTISLRTLLAVDEHETYADFCREERNYAALLYRDLLSAEGLRHFLEKLQLPVPENIGDAEVFFEYAHARDLWARFGVEPRGRSRHEKREWLDRINAAYRRTISTLIGAPTGLLETRSSPSEFNQFFTARPSATHIQMPNQWDQKRFTQWAAEYARFEGVEMGSEKANQFAFRICRLKWAFNAKPDIVIHLPDNRAICVEIKVDSKESVYKCGDKVGSGVPPPMKQTELQRFVLEELLGYQTCFVLLSTGASGALSTGAVVGDRLIQIGWQDLVNDPCSHPKGGSELGFVERMLKSETLQPKRSRGR